MFHPSRAKFPPHFIKTVVEVKASGPPCLTTVVGVSKGMLLVKELNSTKPFFGQSNFMQIIRLLQI